MVCLYRVVGTHSVDGWCVVSIFCERNGSFQATVQSVRVWFNETWEVDIDIHDH